MKNKLPNVFIAIAEIDGMFYFQQHDAISEIKNNECDVPYVPKEKFDVLVAALNEIANRRLDLDAMRIADKALKEVGE